MCGVNSEVKINLRLNSINGFDKKVGKFLQFRADQSNNIYLNKTKIRSSNCFQFPSVELDEILSITD